MGAPDEDDAEDSKTDDDINSITDDQNSVSTEQKIKSKLGGSKDQFGRTTGFSKKFNTLNMVDVGDLDFSSVDLS